MAPAPVKPAAAKVVESPKQTPVKASRPKQVATPAKTTPVKPPQQASKTAAAITAAPVRPVTPVRPIPVPIQPIKPIDPIRPLPPIVLGEAPLEVLRAEDLVSFYLNFVNLKLDTSNIRDPKLVVNDATKPAYLVVWFAPQAILEEAYFETAAITQNNSFNPPVPVTPTTGDTLPAPGTVPAYLAGRTRLVFEVPKSVKSIPYTIEGLLDWSNLVLNVSPVALGTPLPPPLTAPTFLETAIEIPWRIVLSPSKGVGWAHATEPETFAGRTALWHTSLGKLKTVKSGKTTSEVIEEASAGNTIPLRAIWSDDFVDHTQLPQLDHEVPWRASLDPHDRTQIVILTAGTLGYNVPGTVGPGTEWTPVPIEASRLFLSALGGFLDSRGQWPNPPIYTYTDPTTGQSATQELDLIEWDHQATLGRDQYVKVVYAGYLYPFGHAASLIKVTERKIVPPDGVNVTQATAFLRQHMYIVVREPEKFYAADTAQYIHAAREFPFWQSVKITTKVTPDIDIPVMLTGDGNTHNSFWVEVGGTEFQFHVEATDLANSTISFLAPLVFMSLSEDHPGGVQSIYAGSGSTRAATVRGQKIAYADPNAGDTILRTTQLNFTTQLLLTSASLPHRTLPSHTRQRHRHGARGRADPRNRHAGRNRALPWLPSEQPRLERRRLCRHSQQPSHDLVQRRTVRRLLHARSGHERALRPQGSRCGLTGRRRRRQHEPIRVLRPLGQALRNRPAAEAYSRRRRQLRPGRPERPRDPHCPEAQLEGPHPEHYHDQLGTAAHRL